MENIWDALEAQGLSQETIQIIKNSWAIKTTKQYQSAWKKWYPWCLENKIDFFNITAVDLSNFIAFCHKKYGLGYNALNTIKSAISEFASLFVSDKIGKHPMVKRTLNGTVKNKINPKYDEFWDVNILLKFWENRPQNSKLTLKELTEKIISLCAIALIGRSSDLCSMWDYPKRVAEDGIELTFGQLKQDRGMRLNLRRALIPFVTEHPKVCPASTLEHYFMRTSRWRTAEKNKVFLSIRGKHAPLSSQRIAKYLLNSLDMAGINTEKWKAHSFRGASATKLLDLGVGAEDVMRAGRWSSYSVFNKFYDRGTKTVDVIGKIKQK